MKTFVFVDWENQSVEGVVRARTKTAAWKALAKSLEGYISKEQLREGFQCIEARNIR